MASPARASPPMRWIEPARKAWEEVNGKGSFPWGLGGKALKPLCTGRDAPLTPEQVGQYLAVYLRRTESRFVNLFRFATTWQQYDPAQLDIPLVDEFGMLKG